MAQFAFALALAKWLKAEGIHVAMETCGFAPMEQFDQIAPYVDLFLFDYKATGTENHKKLTGVEPSLILENLYRLSGLGKQIVLRCPMVPGVNDSHVHFRGIAKLAQSLAGIREVNILPYHRIGETKRKQMGGVESLPGVQAPDALLRERWMHILSDFGCEAKLV